MIIDIGKGEPDFHTPEHIKRAAHAAIDANFTKYTPQPGIPELREAIAAKFRNENGIDVSPAEIVVSCGGKHAVENAVRCLVQAGDEVLIVSPYWLAYPEQIRRSGGTTVLVPAYAENGYLPDPADLRAALTPRSRLFILTSPNNPTGAVYPRDLLAELAKIAVEHGLMLLSDEVYEKLTYEGAEHVSIAGLDADVGARTVTVNSVSKTHAMTGWRIGYAALPGDLAGRVTALQAVSTSAPSAVSQRAALEALTGDQSHVKEMVRSYGERRRYVLERIGRIPGMTVVPPAGTFYCFVGIGDFLGDIRDADGFVELLRREAEVNLVSGVPFGAPEHVRISFGVGLGALEEGFDRMERFLMNTARSR